MSSNPFFERHASGFAASESHRSGSDLDRGMEMLEASANDSALDIATGTGFTAVRLAGIVRRVVAIDPTQAMLDQAEKLALAEHMRNIEFRNISWEDMDLSEKFDVVTCRRAAHHFADKPPFFRKVHDLLKERGRFLFIDMLRNEDDSTDFLNKLERIRDNTHVGALKLSEIREMAEASGLKVDGFEIQEEMLTFGKWLYPVKEGEKEAEMCRQFINNATEAERSVICFDSTESTLVKRRAVVLMSRNNHV